MCKVKMVVARGCGEVGMRSSCLMGIEFLFYKTKSSGDWLHNNMNYKRSPNDEDFNCADPPICGTFSVVNTSILHDLWLAGSLNVEPWI